MLTVAAAVLAQFFVEFRVMSYNVWVGGTQYQPLEQTVRVIRASGADVVGIQEPGSNLAAIASRLGWNRSDKAAIVTRLRIVSDWQVPGNRWGGARLRTPLGHDVIVYNDHFNAYPYGPYEIRDRRARTVEQVVEVERRAGRVDQMNRILADLAARPDNRLPVVLVGDFNTPSHLDWTEATRTRNFGMVVPWPVTVAAENAGFLDAFRAVYRDPAARPGFTWTPGYPVGNFDRNEVMDRIDYVLFRGPLQARSAEVVGETGPITDIAIDPWPSDHRALVVWLRHVK